MRMEIASVAGTATRANEDFVAAAHPAPEGGSLVLLDGVTPPPGNGGCVHSVPWFTARLGSTLLELAASRPDLDLAACLAAAITRTADAHRAGCDLADPLTPQATVVAVRWDADLVEHLVLSDSVLLLERAAPAGESAGEAAGEAAVEPVLDDRIDRLRAAGRRVAPLRNLEGGFFTAAADPAVAARAVTGSTPRDEIRALAALTDGAARAVEVFRADDWTATFALLRTAGPQALIGRVRALEDAVPPGDARLPGKRHDDATAVIVEL